LILRVDFMKVDLPKVVLVRIDHMGVDLMKVDLVNKSSYYLTQDHMAFISLMLQ